MQRLKQFRKIVSGYMSFKGKASVLRKIDRRIYLVGAYKLDTREKELLYDQCREDFLRAIQIKYKTDDQMKFEFGLKEERKVQGELL